MLRDERNATDIDFGGLSLDSYDKMSKDGKVMLYLL